MSDQGTTGGAAPSAPATSAPAAAKGGASPPAPDNTNGSAPEAANDNATPPEPKFKGKIGEKEGEFTVAELFKLAEKGHGAERKFDEAAGMRKQMEALLQRLPEDTIGALEHLVGDKSKAARQVMAQLLRDPQTREEIEAYLVEQYKYEGLPPDERKRADEDREMREKARRHDEYEKAEKQRQHAHAVERHQQDFQQRFTQALQGAGLPVTQHTIARVALHVERAIDGKERVTMADITARVRDELRGDVTSQIASLDADALAELLGEEKLAALRKRDVERLKPKAPVPERMPGNGKAKAERPPPEKRVTTAQYFRRLRGEG